MRISRQIGLWCMTGLAGAVMGGLCRRSASAMIKVDGDQRLVSTASVKPRVRDKQLALFPSPGTPGEGKIRRNSMDHPLTLFGTAFAGFFAIMNPIANTPIFLGLTEEMDDQTTRSVALRALFMAFLIVAAFSLAGNVLLHLFGITLASFRIAGGLLVGLVGYHLLQGGHSPVQKSKEIDVQKSQEDAMSIAVSPLGMPLLAGPGTIVTGMNFAAGGSPERLSIVLAAFFLICVLTYICFISGHRLTRFLGKSLVMVVSRLMGLILAVIGTQMVIEGVLGVMKS